MIPGTIEIENYRAFADRQRLELRPLTLLYGRNNAGKSAALRALPLLSDSLTSEEMSPLNLESPAVKGASFRDLKWRGQSRRPTIDFRFEWEEGPVEYFEVELAYEDNWNRVVPRRMSLKPDGDSPKDFQLEFLEDEKLEPTLTFRLQDQDADSARQVKIEWEGMLPDSADEALSNLFEELADSLDSVSDGVQWLTSVRHAPDRLVSPPGALPRRLSPRGKGVVGMLHLDDELRRSVSNWYETQLARRLDVIEDAGMLRTVVRSTAEADFDVDLIDCGEGLTQVLPVLTALASLQHERSRAPSVLAIEEPESHLHPKLQRALAEHVCEVVRETPNRRVVLETHSEHILLGIRLAFMQGELERDDIAIHWVSQADDGRSSLQRAELDEDGELTGAWPGSFYTDDAEMARKIWELRRSHDEPGDDR
jgi:predicted ATPase